MPAREWRSPGDVWRAYEAKQAFDPLEPVEDFTSGINGRTHLGEEVSDAWSG